MTNEFHTLDGDCSKFVPSGPGYEGISVVNQVCAVLGSQRAQATVSGSAYVDMSFGYQFRNLWRVRVKQKPFFVFVTDQNSRTLESSSLLAYSSFCVS